MSIDPNIFREMLEATEVELSDEFDIPPIRGELIEPPVRAQIVEPPIRREEPPPSQQELEAAAAEELLKIAAAEEKAVQSIRKAQRAKDTFIIYCPKGCRIRVKEQYRGRTGKCPRCQSEFLVPKN